MARKNRTLAKLGANLRAARENRGWSQEELASRCGLHRTYIGSVERGEYNVTILTLMRIAKKVGITLEDAIGDL